MRARDAAASPLAVLTAGLLGVMAALGLSLLLDGDDDDLGVIVLVMTAMLAGAAVAACRRGDPE